MDERTKMIDWAARNHETTWAALQWLYDEAVAAERERWRALLEARAAGCERAAENTEDSKFDAMARVLMSVREDGARPNDRS